MAFKKAEKKNAKLRLALSGVSGAGKTYSALQFAKEFGTKIAVLDSERGSASLYVGEPGIPEFDVEELDDTSIQTYLEKISDAANNGYDVLVIDSYSHSWISALEAIDKSGGWIKGGKTISPLVQRLVTAVLSYPGHVIAAFRSKIDNVPDVDANGRVKGMKKVGLAPVARPDTEYEFTIWLDITKEGAITVSKTRCSAIDDQVYNRNTDIPRIAAAIKKWLTSGAAPSVRDELLEFIRFAPNQNALDGVALKIKAALVEKSLNAADVEAVRAAYKARKEEFTDAEE